MHHPVYSSLGCIWLLSWELRHLKKFKFFSLVVYSSNIACFINKGVVYWTKLRLLLTLCSINKMSRLKTGNKICQNYKTSIYSAQDFKAPWFLLVSQNLTLSPLNYSLNSALECSVRLLKQAATICNTSLPHRSVYLGKEPARYRVYYTWHLVALFFWASISVYRT